jgi:hypothetical protein
VSPFFSSASETNPIKAGSRSPIARTDRTANHDPVSSKFKTVALSVHGVRRAKAAGDARRYCEALQGRARFKSVAMAPGSGTKVGDAEPTLFRGMRLRVT